MPDCRLFSSERVCLAPLDLENDPPIMAAWTNDSAWVRSFDMRPYRPLSAAQVRTQIEEAEKRSAQANRSVYFAIRTYPQDRLIGTASLEDIEIFNGSAQDLRIAIGAADARRCGLGREALALLLNYAFHEMNLHRVTVRLPAYNKPGLLFFRHSGFKLEARKRLAFQRAGRRWDELILGLLQTEWEENQSGTLRTPDNLIADEVFEGEQPELKSHPASLTEPLLQGKLVRLAAADSELIPSLFTAWQRDGEYARMLDTDPARLWSLTHWKEDTEKGFRDDETNFLIRTLEEDRPIGFVTMGGVPKNHGDTWLAIGIGVRRFWGKGYGEDAMRVAMRYAFEELNLFRVSLNVIGYNERAIRLYKKIGFVEEGREREFCHRDGQRYDLVYMGLLHSDWAAVRRGATAAVQMRI